MSINYRSKWGRLRGTKHWSLTTIIKSKLSSQLTWKLWSWPLMMFPSPPWDSSAWEKNLRTNYSFTATTLTMIWWSRLWSKHHQNERLLTKTMVALRPKRGAFEQYTTNNEPKSENHSKKVRTCVASSYMCFRAFGTELGCLIHNSYAKQI